MVTAIASDLGLRRGLQDLINMIVLWITTDSDAMILLLKTILFLVFHRVHLAPAHAKIVWGSITLIYLAKPSVVRSTDLIYIEDPLESAIRTSNTKIYK